jgi:hypothetical protein
MELLPLQHKLQENDVLIHLHIPKTAGSSLSYLLEQKFPEEAMFHTPVPALTHDELTKMIFAPYRLIRGHVTANIAQYISKTPVFITMLRHPVDRLISFYYFARSQPKNRSYDAANQLSLEEFINSDQLHARVHMNNQMVRILSGQVDKTQFPSRNEFELAKKQLTEMPFFGLTEHFEESAQLLHYTFIWQDPFQVQHKNATPIRPARKEISPETIQRILEYNQLDMELYLFAKEFFHQRYRQMVEELKQDNLTLYRYHQDLKRDNEGLYSQVHNPKLGVMFYRALFPQRFRLLFRDFRAKWVVQPKD